MGVVPIVEDILEGQAQVSTYLGIEIDTVSSIIRFPEDKLK